VRTHGSWTGAQALGRIQVQLDEEDGDAGSWMPDVSGQGKKGGGLLLVVGPWPWPKKKRRHCWTRPEGRLGLAARTEKKGFPFLCFLFPEFSNGFSKGI